ncbi:MAG: hypothetical protein ACYTEL_05215 [Planctomycetota bacterium]|jgi:hypothetical protein
MGTPRIVITMAISFVAFAGAYGQQDWVCSFEKQGQIGQVWDGQKARRIGLIQNKFRRDRAARELYYQDGHLYRLDELYTLAPDLFIPYMTGSTIEVAAGPDLQVSVRSVRPNQGVSGSRSTRRRRRALRSPLTARRGITRGQTDTSQNPVMPPVHPVTLEEYMHAVYCKGLELDLVKGLILPDPNCPSCPGNGKVNCKICDGQGSFPQATARRNMMQRRNLEDLMGLAAEKADLEQQRDMIASELSRIPPAPPVGPYSVRRYRMGDLSIVDVERNPWYMAGMRPEPHVMRVLRWQAEYAEYAIRNIEQQLTVVRQAIKDHNTAALEPVQTSARRREQFRCYPCLSRGWIACPECVLSDPEHDESFKDEYLARFNKKARRSARAQRTSEAKTPVPKQNMAPR